MTYKNTTTSACGCGGKNAIQTHEIKICCDARRDGCEQALEVIIHHIPVTLCVLTFDKIALTHLRKELKDVVCKS